MNKAIMLVGLPGCGKSTYAEKISKAENAIVLSSDALREELYGNVNDQEHNGEVFQELHKRAKKHLRNGLNVIIDATNVNRKRRIHFINEFSDWELEAHYLCSSFNVCKYRDTQRQRSVGEEVIKRMYKQLQVPTYIEGWDNVKILTDNFKIHYDSYRVKFDEYIFGDKTIEHDEMFHFLGRLSMEFYKMFDLSQDSKWHTLSVSRHTYEVWKYIKENYHGVHRYMLLLAAIFHDAGKPFCKEFKRNSRYANFYGHENVSAQIACRLLLNLGYDQNFVLEVVEYIQMHMRLLNDCNQSAEEKIRISHGEVFLENLKFFREADISAK